MLFNRFNIIFFISILVAPAIGFLADLDDLLDKELTELI